MNQVAFIRSLMPLLAMSIFSGCGPSISSSDMPDRINVFDRFLPAVSAADLETLVRRSDRPVLVEFGVNFNCPRCDQMRSEFLQMASELKDRADVVRVDFNANRQLAAQFGATVCPSYVLFDHGHPVATRSYPTSVDLLAADIRSILATNNEGETR